MKKFVLDASVTLAWFVDSSVAPLALHVQTSLLQGGRAIVPHLWRPEVANGFVIAQKRGIISAGKTIEALAELEILLAQSIEPVSFDLSIERIVAAAQQFALTAYDATYLETARTMQLPLATLDRRLGAAAVQAGVSLIA